MALALLVRSKQQTPQQLYAAVGFVASRDKVIDRMAA